MSYPMGLVAQQSGMKVLANSAKEEIPFVHQGLTTSGKFMRERRAQAKAFVRAYGRAVHFMHTRKEEAKAIVSRYTKVTDPAMLEGTMQIRLPDPRREDPTGQARSIPGDLG